MLLFPLIYLIASYYTLIILFLFSVLLDNNLLVFVIRLLASANLACAIVFMVLRLLKVII